MREPGVEVDDLAVLALGLDHMLELGADVRLLIDHVCDRVCDAEGLTGLLEPLQVVLRRGAIEWSSSARAHWSRWTHHALTLLQVTEVGGASRSVAGGEPSASPFAVSEDVRAALGGTPPAPPVRIPRGWQTWAPVGDLHGPPWSRDLTDLLGTLDCDWGAMGRFAAALESLVRGVLALARNVRAVAAELRSQWTGSEADLHVEGVASFAELLERCADWLGDVQRLHEQIDRLTRRIGETVVRAVITAGKLTRAPRPDHREPRVVDLVSCLGELSPSVADCVLAWCADLNRVASLPGSPEHPTAHPRPHSAVRVPRRVRLSLAPDGADRGPEARVAEVIEKLDQLVESVAADPRVSSAGPEDIAALERVSGLADAPPEFREIRRLVYEGRLTWGEFWLRPADHGQHGLDLLSAALGHLRSSRRARPAAAPRAGR